MKTRTATQKTQKEDPRAFSAISFSGNFLGYVDFFKDFSTLETDDNSNPYPLSFGYNG